MSASGTEPHALRAKWQDLVPRTLSALLLIPVVLEMVWVGHAWFQLLVAFLGVMIAKELTQVAHRGSDLQFACHVMAVLAAALLNSEINLWTTLAIVLGLLAASNLLLMRESQQPNFWQRIGVVYVAVPVAALILVRGDSNAGLAATIFLLLLVWFADTFAYFFGRILGGPKLAPILSPNKTWAGLLGAVVGAVVVAAGFVVSGYATGAVWFMVLAAILAVVEQAGDLFKSAFKRKYGIKDSGNLIPGHGGMLDRVDGLMFVFVGAALIGAVHHFADPAIGILQW